MVISASGHIYYASESIASLLGHLPVSNILLILNTSLVIWSDYNNYPQNWYTVQWATVYGLFICVLSKQKKITTMYCQQMSCDHIWSISLALSTWWLLFVQDFWLVTAYFIFLAQIGVISGWAVQGASLDPSGSRSVVSIPTNCSGKYFHLFKNCLQDRF